MRCELRLAILDTPIVNCELIGLKNMLASALGVRRDKAVLFQWVHERSSRKQPEQSWR